MKTNAEPNSQALHFSQSTYAMLLRSEDKRRNILETVVYSGLMLSLVAVLMPLSHLVTTADKKAAPQRPLVATVDSL
jgi:hypothetical protein